MGNVHVHKNKYYCELILPDDTLLYKLKKKRISIMESVCRQYKINQVVKQKAVVRDV